MASGDLQLPSPRADLTLLLRAAACGDNQAADALYGVLYDDLRRLARRQLGRQRDGTLDTVGVVNEAYLKLVGANGFADRGHFFRLAARAMRQVVVDAARGRGRDKRGGGRARETLDEHHAVLDRQLDEVLAVNQALDRLEEADERLRRVVECRYFAGMTEPETAEALGVSERTVRRLWHEARARLRRELAP